MKSGDAGTQIAIAAATAAVATTIGVLITNFLTKRSTTQDIASGKQPLPPGSTPTTTGPPVTATPVPQPQPAPQPSPLNIANSIANQSQVALPKQPCPPGYHSVPTGQPNFPYMCIQDSP